MLLFQQNDPTLESYWRAIILFGKNTASYKFALAKSLLELTNKDESFISLEELALPFSNHITEHLKKSEKQSTNVSSRFLEACKNYNLGTITQDALMAETCKTGFRYVLDAFHVINDKEIDLKFYQKQNHKEQKGLVITDDFYKLKESYQFDNFIWETEARWNLVEKAWELNMNPNMLSVKYDIEKGLFFTEHKEMRRINITSARNALNGYQKGKCFYCFDDISIISSSDRLAEVDHFFPHVNKLIHTDTDINGVWNLVLSCKTCNLSKLARIPNIKLIERLNKRNDFFIESHHPLRETLIMQTGSTKEARIHFLKEQDKIAINACIHRWKPENEFEKAF